MIDLETIRAAAAAIAPHILRTPLRPSYYFSELSGFDVSMKLENWQPTGAFKVRGALNLVRSLPIQERLRGLVAWSAGNHALGVAYASSVYDAPATIYVPRKTPRSKLDKLQYFNVDVRRSETYEDCEREGRALAEKMGLTIVHPYDDWRTVAGQGTIGLELHEQMPELDAVVVPVGGGGMISGIAIALKSLDPDVKIIAVQTANSPSLQKSLDDKVCYEEFPVDFSIAEGLAGGIGKIVYDLAPTYIDEILLVDEEEIKNAIVLLLEHEQVVAEASAAITLAALAQVESVPRGSRVASIISGGNLNMKLLREILH
ncbi:MAG TPA: threonine/serine dehydratase [Acidobacteriota bacterium]|nr:threonine/serine dehydratase [Acidobacteriota bacterium]